MTAVPSNRRRTKLTQSIVFWMLRLATYFVLGCATYIFLDIAIKGSRTVFTTTAPFINVRSSASRRRRSTSSTRGAKDDAERSAIPPVEDGESRSRSRAVDRRIFRGRHLAGDRRHGVACYWVDGARAGHRHQQRDLS
jgi:hypothetical protein